MTWSARSWLGVITGLSVLSIWVGYTENSERINDIQKSRVDYLVTECEDINRRHTRSSARVTRLEEHGRLTPRGAAATRLLIDEVLPPREDCRRYALEAAAPPPLKP